MSLSAFNRIRGVLLIFVGFLFLALAGQAWACPVCYGDSDDPILKGAAMSILFMAALTYLLIGAGVVVFIVLRRRARRLQPSTDTA